ncbi:MAG: hypothetical protein AB1405_03490 [Bdellovibrionota bacterium]
MPLSFRRRGPKIKAEHKARFEQESLCNDCGACCHLAFEVDGKRVSVKELPCKHLRYDAQGKSRCEIYSRRLETDFCCKVSARSVRMGLFPSDCPYVEGIEGYRGAIPLESHPELRERVVQEYGSLECPEYIRPRDWLSFFNGK